MNTVHTFIFYPATWTITGTYVSAGKMLTVAGKTVVANHDTIWNIDSLLTIKNGGALHINYDVPSTTKTCVPFTASSNALGEITGTFTIQNNQINEVYANESRQITGQEIMTMINKKQYTSQGALYNNGTMKSTWTLNYQMQE